VILHVPHVMEDQLIIVLLVQQLMYTKELVYKIAQIQHMQTTTNVYLVLLIAKLVSQLQQPV